MLKVKLKAEQSHRRELVLELWDVTCHMVSHSFTCHQTQVKVPRLNPSQ